MVGISKKIFIRFILVQAWPSMGMWPIIHFLFLFFTAGAQAMWEGGKQLYELANCKTLKDDSHDVISFLVESDSYGISFQRNGIINDNRYVMHKQTSALFNHLSLDFEIAVLDARLL